MVNLRKKIITLSLAMALVLTGFTFNITDSNAATIIPFWHSKTLVSKTYLSKFSFTDPNAASTETATETGEEAVSDTTSLDIKGAYSESGQKAFLKNGTAKQIVLAKTGKPAKLIFYYAVYKDQARTNAQKLKIQNALTYLHQGATGLTTSQVNTAKTMINTSSKYAIPAYYNFKAYRFKSMEAVNGKYPQFIGYVCDPYQIRVGVSYNNAGCIESIKQFGGYPVLLPYIKTEAEAVKELANVDCLLIPGGSGIKSTYYGEEYRYAGKTGSALRDPTDYNYIKTALNLDMPIFAICRGHQMLNVVTGGTLFQDIQKEFGTSEGHKKILHNIRVLQNTMLAGIIGSGSHKVYCNHHQCTERIGKNIKVNARSTNGVVEAANVLGKTFALSVQFHPESQATYNYLDTYKLFTRFINEGSKYIDRKGRAHTYMKDVPVPTEKEINEAEDASDPS